MLEDSSDDSELEVDVVEISDTNSEATRSPSSPSKRPLNRPQRKSLDTSKGAKMNVPYSQPSLIWTPKGQNQVSASLRCLYYGSINYRYMYTVYKFFISRMQGHFCMQQVTIIFLTNRSHFTFKLQLYVAHRWPQLPLLSKVSFDYRVQKKSFLRLAIWAGWS